MHSIHVIGDKIGKKERRNSISVFSASFAPFAGTELSSHARTSSDDCHRLKKTARRNSSFLGLRNASPTRDADRIRPEQWDPEPTRRAVSESLAGSSSLPTPAHNKKRSSVFGSLRSLHSWDDDKSIPRSRGSSGEDDEQSFFSNGLGSIVLHHGEVQTMGGLWRKKSRYLVLTDTHLVRFKSRAKATEIFPTVTASYSRTLQNPRFSTASSNSLHDAPGSIHGDSAADVALNSIIAVYALDDGRPLHTVEVAFVDDRTHKAAFMQMQMLDPEELNLWMAGIRSAAEVARSTNPLPFDLRTVDYVARMLEHERDYDPTTFRLFRVIQIASSKPIARASSDDIPKLSPTGSYLAIGSHKIHVLPMQKVTNRSSTVSLNDVETASSFGLMTLTGLSMEWGGDSLSMKFRVPFCKSVSAFLASVHSADIALWIRQRTEFLRPLWKLQPYDFVVPRELDNEDNFPPVELDEDYGCFDRTLVAYAAGYDVDTSNIRYTIDTQCEDAPCFRLLAPVSPTRRRYTALELIAVFRSLRYNESFRSISFSRVNLDALRGLRDSYGSEPDAHLGRGGTAIYIPGQENLSILSQEIRALALKSKWLRRLDFSYCVIRTPSSDNGSRDPGCGIPEAIFPVCRRELTSVDWVVLNGIQLGDSDLDYLVDGASQRGSHLRAVEVGDCGLSVHDVDLLLSTMAAQELTLEAINISGVQGRLSPNILQQHLGYFGQIRKMDLSRISRTSGPEPILSAEMLFQWRLEELSLSQTAVNAETVEAIATYLACDGSRSLRLLRLDQCGLTGPDVATFLYSMADEKGKPRNLHLYVNENRLDMGCSHLFNAIARNKTPTHLSMSMIDFKKEEHFRGLAEALRKNMTLKYLDISKASLPYEAGPETCRSLQLMFEENETLEDLDISGDSAPLDVARFGIGLNQALAGLKKNKALKILKIEHQKLGLPGANSLASVLEENVVLREVYCDHNDINLQSLTVLVNGLKRNKFLLNLSCMDSDRIKSLEKVLQEMQSVAEDTSRTHYSTSSTIRRSLHAAMSVSHVSVTNRLTKASSPSVQHRVGAAVPSAHVSPMSSGAISFSDHNVDFVMKSLNDKWDVEVQRMRRYLLRNLNLINRTIAGQGDVHTDDAASDGRPTTANSLCTMLNDLTLDMADANPSEDISECSPEIQEGTNGMPPESGNDIQCLHPQKSQMASRSASSSQDSPFINDYSSSCTSSQRIALPVPILAQPVQKSYSVRSARSTSTASTSTGSRSNFGSASSTLKELFISTTAREKRRLEKLQVGAICVANNGPPKLDWTPPELDLGNL